MKSNDMFFFKIKISWLLVFGRIFRVQGRNSIYPILLLEQKLINLTTFGQKKLIKYFKKGFGLKNSLLIHA
jgi:hypothetical protein